MKTLNAENEALNGRTINEEVEGLVGSIAGPMKGLLVNNSGNNDKVIPAVAETSED
jgi:hypothetical protein